MLLLPRLEETERVTKMRRKRMHACAPAGWIEKKKPSRNVWSSVAYYHHHQQRGSFDERKKNEMKWSKINLADLLTCTLAGDIQEFHRCFGIQINLRASLFFSSSGEVMFYSLSGVWNFPTWRIVKFNVRRMGSS